MAKTNVKDRVAQTAGRNVATTQGTNAPAAPRTLEHQLQLMVPQFARAMPKSMDPDRLARIALTEYRRNPGLAECTPQSFFGALMQAATLGTEPGLVGHAYLVPYKNRKTGTKEVQFILGYKGMLDLVRRSGEVIGTPKARIVYAHDIFRSGFGLEEDDFEHVPYYMRTDEIYSTGGDIRGAYVIARYKEGGADFFYLPLDKILERRERSMAKDSGPWKTDFEAMVLKTVVRAAFTWLPVSIEHQRATADADGNVTRIDPTSLDVQVTQITHTVDGEVVDSKTGEVLEDEEPPPPQAPSRPPEGAGLFDQ
ncbi:MAG: recombinase RecT [Deferrisomatales bacterium]|nr:recombinase RecT [Deferrisomatales bacterium]